MSAAASYVERLGTRSAATHTVLCLGLDPDPDGLPDGFTPDLHGIERFATVLAEVVAPHVAAIKPNLAFFEAYGSDGIAALERIRQRLPEDVMVLVDAKRGDIGTTAVRQAVAIVERLRADAVTLNPYLGRDAIAPFLAHAGTFAYVLCRTSNPSGGEVQGQVLVEDRDAGFPSEPLYQRVARLVDRWAEPGRLGLVLGATAPLELAAVRDIVPGLPFLVPGVGAQGGDEAAVLTHGPATQGPAGRVPGGGLLVNVSRGIAAAARSGSGGSLEDRLTAAARGWAARLPVLS